MQGLEWRSKVLTARLSAPVAMRVAGPIRLRHFREQRITVYEPAA
jgi:hypothetical protein